MRPSPPPPVAATATPSSRARLPWAALALATTLAACGGSQPVASRPDVVLVVFDTLRADRLSCYGYERPTSPVIDALAARGTRFARNSSQAPWTKPSMASMLTSRYLTDYRDVFEPEAQSLAAAFREAGYRTLGTTANMLVSRDEGFDRGFEFFDDHRVPNRDTKHKRKEIARTFEQLIDDLEGPLAEVLPEGQSAGERAPLFLYVHVMDPHYPYRSYPQLAESLPISDGDGLPRSEWQRAEFERRGAPPGADDPGWKQAWTTISRESGRYDQELRYCDQLFERLFARLEQLGVSEPLVAVAADHGEGLWDRVSPLEEARLASRAPSEFFYRDHGKHLIPELLETPLILAGPGVPDGKVVDERVENVDLMPTLLELAGIEIPSSVHGTSLVDLMWGRAPGWNKDVHAYVRGARLLIEGASGLRLVEPDGFVPKVEIRPSLFALEADPDARTNLWSEDSADVARLRGLIEAWRRDYPTSSNLAVPKDPATLADLKALGYIDDDEEE